MCLLTPVLPGWFWAGSDVRLGSRDGAVTGDWSKTGGAGEPQPDNREFKVRHVSISATDIVMLSNSFGALMCVPSTPLT